MIPQPPTLDRIRDSMHAAIWAFFAGLAIVVLGISFGLFVMPISDGPRSPSHVPASGNGLMDTLTRWDGQWYLEIVEQGYTCRPDRRSNVAFFPAYPMCITARCPSRGHRLVSSQFRFSLAFLFASMAVLHDYARKRFPAAAPKLAGLCAPVHDGVSNDLLLPHGLRGIVLFLPRGFGDAAPWNADGRFWPWRQSWGWQPPAGPSAWPSFRYSGYTFGSDARSGVAPSCGGWLSRQSRWPG